MTYSNICKNCKKDVHCCIFEGDEGFAFVDLKTAEKIKKQTGKEYRDFLDFSPLSPQLVKAMKNEDSHLEGSMRLNLLDDNNRILRFRKKSNWNCIFLNDDRRCDIYDIRPNICRIYPWWAMRMINGQLKVIRHDEHPRCGIIKELQAVSGDRTDMEDVLPKNETREIKRIMKKIEEENIYYLENIKEFARKNKLE